MKRGIRFAIGTQASAFALALLWSTSAAMAQVDLSDTAAKPGEHPLAPAIRIAESGLKYIDETVQDYSCTLIKRERINGELGANQHIFVKVRHQPFSVYMYFLGPDDLKTNEAMYIEGRNRGKARCRTGRGLQSKFGWVSLDPNAVMMMKGQRYPITMTGIRYLTDQMIQIGKNDMKFGESEVKFFKGAKINGRECMCIQSVHPTPRKQFRYHMARIFIDEEMTLPVRYAAYSWPKNPGGKPVLEEEYTYVNLKLNNGFTDADFDDKAPGFRSAHDANNKRRLRR